jgi:hypothetical protein
MTRTRSIVIGCSVTLVLLAGLAIEIVATAPVRGAVRACARLLSVANRPDLGQAERLELARALCSTRYGQENALAVAAGHGLVGMPRNIHKNFQAWREGRNVWICPNRTGPVYQFVFERGDWRFDGLVGILGQRGEVVRTTELPEVE